MAKREKKMQSAKSSGFGKAICQRRRELALTQEEVARRTKMSSPYVGLLESGKRRPSEDIVIKLAQALGLDRRELFLLANPEVELLISQEPESAETSAWESFAQDLNVRKIYNITDLEMQILSQVAAMGKVRSARDFVFVLISIRLALGR